MNQVFKIGALLILSGCMTFSKDKESDSQTVHRVMVIDSDFDESLSIFQGKIAGTYTLYCAENESQPCILKEGLEYKPQQNPRVLALREKWNHAVKMRDFASLSVEEVKYMNENMNLSHGTATAAVIAYKNPKVQLYLVQREPHKEEKGDITSVIKSICASPDQMNSINQAFTLRQTMWETLVKETNQRELAIHNFAVKHKIDLINKSYGSIGPDEYMRKIFKEMFDCPVLGEFLIQDTRLEHARIKEMRLYAKSVPYLILQSAGNENSRIDSEKDTGECMIRNGNHLLVGSFNAYDQVSPFSNYGNCVDFYTLGSQVISATIGDVLIPVDGTSFSSPLAVRSLTGLSIKNPVERKAAIASMLDERRFLKADKTHMNNIAFQVGAGKGLSLAGKSNHGPYEDFFSRTSSKDELLREAVRSVQGFIRQ